MEISFDSLTDRQKRLVEARLAFNEDAELRTKPLSWIARDRRGYGLVKTRFQTALGLSGREAAWVIDNMPTADYGSINAAGALTLRTLLTAFPLINPAHVLGSFDPEPFEQSTLAAASGDRQIGTSSQAIALLLGAYVIHITSAGAVYQPATTTINIRVQSSALTVGGAFTTEATLNVATAANFIDQIPISSTTGRQVSLSGTNLTNICALFNGDSLFSELVLGGATNIQANILAVLVEMV